MTKGDSRTAVSILVGDFLVDRLVDGDNVAVDAGTFFPATSTVGGVADQVPKDPVELAFNFYVVRSPEGVAIIDTGVGVGKAREDYREYSRQRGDVPRQMEELGVSPHDVDLVICTHLHPDHIGWNTSRVDGAWKPFFPRATYVFPQEEFVRLAERWAHGERDGWALAAYADSIRPIIEHGCDVQWAGNGTLMPGLSLLPFPGHSSHHHVVQIESAGQHAIFSGDVFHHLAQVKNPDLNSCYDEFPELACRSRRRLLAYAASAGTVLFPAHLHGSSAVRIRPAGAGYDFEVMELVGEGADRQWKGEQYERR